jgi:predicted Zn-dependent protease
LNDEFAVAYVLKGAALFHQEKHGEALTLLEKAKHDAPMDAGVFLWLGKTLLQLGEIEEARTELQKALDIDNQYVAAYRALADVYEKTDQRDEAAAAREKAKTLESELRKAAALDQLVADGAGPSRIAETDQFDPAIISAESLRSQTPRAELLTQKVRDSAERQRQELKPWQRDLEVCEATSVVPGPCSEADEVYRRSVHLFDVGDFEVADVGFKETKNRYQAALDAFEEKASKDHTVWLNWAQQRAEQVSGSSQLTLLTTMAIVYSRLGDKQRYSEMMKRVDSRIQATGVMNPVAAFEVLFQVAEIRDGCGDQKGAQAAIKEAAIFCDGITSATSKSIRLARCAGALVRYGARDMWASYMGKAIKIAEQVSSARQRQLLYVQCVGYGAAGDMKRAYAYAQKLEQLVRSTSTDSHMVTSGAYTRAARAAARADQNRPENRQLFENSYVASIIRMMATTRDSSESRLRFLLGEVDRILGATERAWAGATSSAWPLMRTWSMRPIIRQQCERGNLPVAREMFEHLPQGAGTIRPVCYLAEAEVRFGERSFVSLRHWVEELPTTADRAAAMAGIALGVRAGRSTSAQESDEGNRESDAPGPADKLPMNEAIALGNQGNHRDATAALAKSLLQAPDDARVREAFDKSAASAAAWWLEEAISYTTEVEDSCVRACLWLQVARTQLKSDNTNGYRFSIDKVRECTLAMWNRILERRLPDTAGHDSTSYWKSHARRKTAEFEEITAMLRVLMDLEELQHKVGETQEALETLLLALRCVELMPKNTSVVIQVSPQCAAAWLMRIAGRLARRGRHDLANLMLADGPWFPSRRRLHLLPWAAAESNDVAKLQELEISANKWTKSSEGKTRAARINAFLAMVAARRGDRDLYRKAAMKVGGYVSQGRNGASRIVFLDLAEAAAVAGQPDAALEYVKNAKWRGHEGDAAWLAITEKMLELGRVSAAKEIVQNIRGGVASVRGRYVVAVAEASAASANLSTLYVEADELPGISQKAAAMAGIATALHGR